MGGPRNPTILLVDDEPDILQLLHALFADRARLLTASTGREAIALLATEAVDVAVLDKNLPDRSGLEVAQEAALLPFRPEVVLITAYSSPDSARQALRQGFFDYLEKPFDIQKVKQVVDSALARAGKRRERLQPLSPGRHRVLVVEDEEDTAHLIRKLLEDGGCEVEWAVEGGAALERIRRADFDAMVVDVSMAGMGGIELLAAVNSESADLQVIIATACADLPTAIACLRAGAFDFVQKPISASELRASVGRAISTKELRDASALYRASQVVFSSPPTQSLAQVLVDVSIEVMSADGALLMLPDTDQRLYLAHGRHPAEVDARRLPLSELVAIRMTGSGAPFILDASELGAAGVDPIHSVLVFPLSAGSRPLGAIVLYRTARHATFRRTVLPRASVLASMLGLALENRRLEQQLVSSERLAAIGQISAGIVHEINNPATYAHSNMQYLNDELAALAKKGVDVSGVLGAAADALEGVQRIRDIAADMRGLCRESIGGVEERCDLSEAIRSASRIAGVEVRRRGRLVMELATGLVIPGSVGRLSQVFVNLLVNAAHAMDERRTRGAAVFVTSRRDGAFAEVQVRDTGPGVPEALRQRIFEPFFTSKASTKGTGLGLSICRDLIQRMQGEISVGGTAEGAVFTIRLPLAAGAEIPSSSPESQAATDLAAGRSRVLFVDDEPGILRWYARLFEKDYEVVVAADGGGALEMLRAHAIDLVVCDLIMPGMTGMELFAQIERDRPDLGDRFLFVTGGPNQEDVRSFIRSTRAPVMEKPWVDAELRRSVADLLSRA